MVQIIKGTYGHYDGHKVIPINEKSGPQSFAPEVEERLVKKGVAVYVGDTPAAGNNDAGDGMPAYNADMKLDELKKIAEAYGVDASKAKSKKAVIDMIEAAKAAQDDADDDNDDDGVVDDGETPPAVGAAMPE